MKRIRFACLEQTIHFFPKEDVDHNEALEIMYKELADFKARLERGRKKYQIVEEITQPDETIIVKLKRQYNDYACGEYIL